MRRATPVLLILSMVLAAGAVVAIVVHGGGDRCDDYAFNRAEWVERQHGETSNAGPLADELHDCRVLQGMPRARVRALLGAPTSDGGSPNGAGQWNYDLGHYRDDFDRTVLTVEFDERGLVRSTAVG